MGYFMVHGYCYGCGQPFMFNAERVPSIRVDGSREPICRNCVEHANPLRAANGLDPIIIHPDSYEPSETLG